MFYYTNKSQQIFKKSTFQRSSTGPWKIDRSTINMDILRIRRMNLYGIFLRMIHHLLWMSRHRKRWDRLVDLRKEVGGKVPNRSKAFPRSDTHDGSDHPIKRLIFLKLPYWFKPFYQCILSSRDTFKKKVIILILKIIPCTGWTSCRRLNNTRSR